MEAKEIPKDNRMFKWCPNCKMTKMFVFTGNENGWRKFKCDCGKVLYSL